jgi:hypothetical protein
MGAFCPYHLTSFNSIGFQMNQLFNIWHDAQHSKTTIIANDMNQALDIFCSRHGFIDHADYCQEKGLTQSDLNIESVN